MHSAGDTRLQIDLEPTTRQDKKEGGGSVVARQMHQRLETEHGILAIHTRG